MLGLVVHAIDQGIAAAKVHHRETKESLTRGEVAEKACLAQRVVVKAKNALQSYNKQLHQSAPSTGTVFGSRRIGCLPIVHCVLPSDQQSMDPHLQSLQQVLQEAQTRYDQIMLVEDTRLQRKAKRARKAKSIQLGTSKTIEKAAVALVDNLKKARHGMEQEGTISPR